MLLLSLELNLFNLTGTLTLIPSFSDMTCRLEVIRRARGISLILSPKPPDVKFCFEELQGVLTSETSSIMMSSSDY